MPTGDETNRGSKFGDGPEAQVRGPDPDGPETEPAQAIPGSGSIPGGVGADRDGAAHTAGAGTGTVDVADFAEFSRALVEIGLIDAEGLDAFAVAPAEGVPGLSRALIKAGKDYPIVAHPVVGYALVAPRRGAGSGTHSGPTSVCRFSGEQRNGI